MRIADTSEPKDGSDIENAPRTSAFSDDRGLTWTKGGRLGGYRSGAAFLPRTGTTGSPSTGVIAVGPNGSDVSYDGGLTWQQVDKGDLDSVECTPSGACWASGFAGRVAILRGLS